MKTHEIRKKFLDFFKSKEHTIVASDSLVPKDDPTVLFTTAGMQQFKLQFLGQIDSYTRATTSQKCLRTDDLDEVGKTDFHHTFFEMLGNFSFGDYFKKEAIAWAWEFLTQVVNIPQNNLWVSVYKEDKEAADIWLNDIGIPEDRLVRLGDKSNFWPADAKKNGPNGPCGPCSEIFYDYGVNPDCPSQTCDPDCDCGRFSEVWNLVFTQFNRKEGGVLEPLPSKNIDTGMGLERLSAVLQGVKTNFDTDTFAPIFKKIDEIFTRLKIELTEKERRILADHIRAIVFAINDGIIPSNKERGYVIKGLITNSSNIALSHGATDPTVYQLAPAVVEAIGDHYTELKDKITDIESLIKKTEEAFIDVRKQRIPQLESDLKKKNLDPTVLGKIIFTYRDTYGLPINTILSAVQSITKLKPQSEIIKKALTVFKKSMQDQQERSRASSKMTGDVFTETNFDLNVSKTKFVGYDQMTSSLKVLKIFDGSDAMDKAIEGSSVKVVFDQTPFYAESGGQVGDTGKISSKDFEGTITDTQKINDIFIHDVDIKSGTLKVGSEVQAAVDKDRRQHIMRNHTATHLLQSALREVLGSHIQQQGSLVDENRLRFDFTHPKALSSKDISDIEKLVNGWVWKCSAVQKQVMSIEEAKKSGALAFFAEKYGDTVRVVSVDDISKEFCGGTHLNFTGEIGLFKITAESAIAQGIRRIEARTGAGAFMHVNEEEKLLNKISQTLKANKNETVERIEAQRKRIKDLEKELQIFRFEQVKNSIDAILHNAPIINGSKIICYNFDNADVNLLRQMNDLLKQKTDSAVILLGGCSSDSGNLLLNVSDDLIKKGIQANELIKPIAALIDGKGGGRPQTAQAGTRSMEKIESAVKEAEDIIKKEMGS